MGVMEEKPFGENVEIEGFYFNGSEGADGEGTFAISSAQDRKPRRGWTAYAPMGGFEVERHGDQYKVHWEVSFIK